MLHSRALHNILLGAPDLAFLDASELYKISQTPERVTFCHASFQTVSCVAKHSMALLHTTIYAEPPVIRSTIIKICNPESRIQ